MKERPCQAPRQEFAKHRAEYSQGRSSPAGAVPNNLRLRNESRSVSVMKAEARQRRGIPLEGGPLEASETYPSYDPHMLHVRPSSGSAAVPVTALMKCQGVSIQDDWP